MNKALKIGMVVLGLLAMTACNPVEIPHGTPTTPPVVKEPSKETGIRVDFKVVDRYRHGLDVRFAVSYVAVDATGGDVIYIDGRPFNFTRNKHFPTGTGTDTMLYGVPDLTGILTYTATAIVPNGSRGIIKVRSLPSLEEIPIGGITDITVEDNPDNIVRVMSFKFVLLFPTR